LGPHKLDEQHLILEMGIRRISCESRLVGEDGGKLFQLILVEGGSRRS
jgi:hypothetical protein